jgi:biofilm PGA synthesis N-glycosyltransferase PgaC
MDVEAKTVTGGRGLAGELPLPETMTRFALANLGALAFASAASLLAVGWARDLAPLISMPVSVAVIALIAIIPGYLNAFLLLSLLLYRQAPISLERDFPPVTILIAAYNEVENLPETLRGIDAQDYPAEIELVIVDDGSSDGTLRFLRSIKRPHMNIIPRPHLGKAAALNAGLKAVSHRTVVTIDADTFLHRQALRRIVSRLLDSPGCAAVAGSVLAKNSRRSRLTRMQEWDYLLGIGAVKRQQSMYRGTLVAQGSFSAFRTGVLRASRGWPDRIGEDIVLTWALLDEGYRVGHEPTAIGFTRVPESYRGFSRQRQRWARGMIEALKSHGA